MVPRWLRAVIPTALILVWLTVAGIGGPYFGRISEVSSTDQTSFLPASSEATQVQNLLVKFRGDKTIPAIVVFARDSGVTKIDRRYVDDTAIALASRDGVAAGASPAIPSADGKAFEIILPLESGIAQATVKEIRATLTDKTPAGLSHYVTGPAGFTADLGGAFAGIDGVLLLVALAAVLIILLVVYRSPLLPLLVLGTTTFALTASILIVWWLAKAGVVTINGQVQGILFILVIGAATDYCLLYVSRYREALRAVAARWDATLVALRGSLEPVLASGGTVIVGLLCLLLSDLNSNKALGPVAAIGVAMSVLAALTLLPALLLVFGRATFWPLRPKFHPNHAIELSAVPARGLWVAIGRLISRHARIVWVGVTLLLLVASLGVFQLKADGVPQSDLILGVSQARDGQAVLGKHFAAGSGSPAIIVGDAGKIGELADAAAAVTGVGAVSAVAGDTGAATTPLTTDANSPGRPGSAPAVPRVVDGRVMLQATLTAAADSPAADLAILALRTALKTVDSKAIVGGATATAVDTNVTSIEDRNRIIPIVFAVILLILMLLLRSILAPVLLVASVIVSFGAALGVAALVFNGIFHFPGVDPSVPLFGFVFLVALGIDYNIFLMTRVREETLALGTRPGILRGLTVTGGVITSAGLVLAATFAALSVIPVLFLAQISFIVAFGVLLDTLLVRSLLVPALAHDLGRRIWWPSKLSRFSPTEAALQAPAPAPVLVAPHRASHAAPAHDAPVNDTATDDTATDGVAVIHHHDAAHPAAHAAPTGEVVLEAPISGTFEEVIAPPDTDPPAPPHEPKENR